MEPACLRRVSADVGFVGLDDADPATVTGYKAAGNCNRAPAAWSEAVQPGCGARAPVEHAFAPQEPASAWQTVLAGGLSHIVAARPKTTAGSRSAQKIHVCGSPPLPANPTA